MSTQAVPTFAELGLAEPIVRAVVETGYEAPSPIQAAAVPPLLAGRDLLGQAQTGTGKTAAFALPLLSRLNLGRRQPQLLVLTPTRELAIQVAEAMQTYARHLSGFHVLPIYGGQGMGSQLRLLERGVHAVVGTPGRIADHLRRGTLRLDALIAVVLDEADEMLRMGFIDEVTGILDQTPANKQVALFSATMPSAIARIAKAHLEEPVEIRIASKTSTVSAVTQQYWEVSGAHKLDALTRVLEVEDFDAMLVFVRTRNATVELCERLEARGHACAALSGDMPQASRERTVEKLRGGAIDIVVATDVAARGLDVERITHVLNYDVPYDTEAYVHRIGRTGRAGRGGTAIVFVAPRERRMLRAIEQATGQRISHMRMPSNEDISDRRVARFKQSIADTIAAQDLSFLTGVIDDYQAEHDVSATHIAAALAWQLQREKPLRPTAQAPAGRRTQTTAATPPAARSSAKDEVATTTAPPARQSKSRPPRAAPPAIVEAASEAGLADAGATMPAPARATRPPASPGEAPPEQPTSGRKAGRPTADSAPPTQASADKPRTGRKKRPDKTPAAAPLLRYRIAVGRAHGAEPKHIVGAIANESGLDSEFIGRVRIEETHSTVELPEGMPKVIFKHLKKVWVCGQRLAIAPDRDAGADKRPPREQSPGDERPRSAGFDKYSKSKRSQDRAGDSRAPLMRSDTPAAEPCMSHESRAGDAPAAMPASDAPPLDRQAQPDGAARARTGKRPGGTRPRAFTGKEGASKRASTSATGKPMGLGKPSDGTPRAARPGGATANPGKRGAAAARPASKSAGKYSRASDKSSKPSPGARGKSGTAGESGAGGPRFKGPKPK